MVLYFLDMVTCLCFELCVFMCVCVCVCVCVRTRAHVHMCVYEGENGGSGFFCLVNFRHVIATHIYPQGISC
jgi:hypothetical protein